MAEETPVCEVPRCGQPACTTFEHKGTHSLCKAHFAAWGRQELVNHKGTMTDLRDIKPPQGGSSTAHQLTIVGTCPRCGAPIYGRRMVTSDKPEVRYSCECRLKE